MGIYTGEGARVNQLLHWEFVLILNKINNILTDGNNNGRCMLTRDFQHFPTPTCASTLHNVHIQEGYPDRNPNIPFMKGRTGYTSPLVIFCYTFSSIFGLIHHFQSFDSSLCLTRIEPNLALFSIGKLQME